MRRDIAAASPAFLLVLSRRNNSGGLDPGAQGEGNVLARRHARLAHNNKACDDPKRNLRSNEPEPVDVAREQRVQQAQDGIKRSEEHTSELQSRGHLVCRLLLEKKKEVENFVEQKNVRLEVSVYR